MCDEIVLEVDKNNSQEIEGQKTNNGIHYRLQLLYTSGEWKFGSIVKFIYISKFSFIIIKFLKFKNVKKKLFFGSF